MTGLPSGPACRVGSVALAAFVLVGFVAQPSQAGGDAEVLRRAQAASATVAFVGTVVVRWLDGDGIVHDEPMQVRGTGSALELTANVNQPSLNWAGGVGPTRLAPDPTTKYEVSAQPGPYLLGRPTTRVVLRLDQVVTEEADVDDESGLLLRRQVFDAQGTVVRVVEFTSLSAIQTIGVASPIRAGAGGVAQADQAAIPSAVPEQLAAGYARLGAYRRGSAVQVLYGDGVRTLSVFTQPGMADPSSLPVGGERLEVGGTVGHRWTWAGGQVVTWSFRGSTTTVVGDGPPAEVLAVARSVPAPARPGFTARLRATARYVVRTIV